MCEIAVVPGAQAESNAENYIDLAATLYQQNSHGLGIIAVYDESAGREDAFDYSYYKTTDPTERWGEIYDWLQERSDAWRFVFHARLATAGGKSVEATHPLVMEDDDIDSELVVHNGQVYAHRRKRRNLEDDGHEFATEVDSEVIAHTHDDVPETLDDFDGTQLRGNLNYLLFADHGILVRNSGKYTLAEDLTMSCRPVNKQTAAEDSLPVDDDSVDGLGQSFALFKPDGSYEHTDAGRKTYERGSVGNAGSTRGARYGRGYTSSSSTGNGYWNDDTDDSDSDDADSNLRLGDKASYVDNEGVKQVREKAVVEYAPSVRQDELDRFAITHDGYFTVTALDSVIKDDHFTITVKDDQENAVKNARIFVRCPADDMSYAHRGVYQTDETGAVMLPEPDNVIMVAAKLVTVPAKAFPEGAIPDAAADGDDDDDDDQPMTDAQAAAIDWWHHYGETEAPTDKDGFCALCMSEFEGATCQLCLDRHGAQELIEQSKEALEDEVYDENGEPVAPAAYEE